MKSGTVRTVAAHASALALLVAGVTACSGPQDYAVPGEICGREVPEKDLGSVLPGGQKLRDEVSRGDRSSSCRLYVDGTLRLSLDEYAGQRTFDVLARAKGGELGHFDQLRTSDVSDNAVVSRTRSVVMTPCEKTGKNYVLDVQLSTAEEDRSADLERFIRSYLPSGRAAMGC